MSAKAQKLEAKAWVSAAVRLAFFPVAVLLPAGTWRWWEAWAVVGLYVAYAVAITLYLSRRDPDLLRERLKSSPAQQGQKRWDKILMIAMLVPGIALFIVPGLDVGRFGWSAPLPAWVEIVGLALHLPCFAVIGWVMHENSYLARVVKVDEERGHTVVKTGPYAIVRHPMYAAVIPMVFAFPLALGSRWGLVPAALMNVLLIVRTVLEDRTLHRELPGYPEYAAKTRHRLIPGVW